MTPEQAIEQIAYICFSKDPGEDGAEILGHILYYLERYCPIEYAAAKSRFEIQTRQAIETMDQLEPAVREAVFRHFGR